MEKYYITFRSVTYAQKGERILNRADITCSMLRTPRWMEAKGCGYALVIRDFLPAIRALQAEKAAWEKIYRLKEGEKPEVVHL